MGHRDSKELEPNTKACLVGTGGGESICRKGGLETGNVGKLTCEVVSAGEVHIDDEHEK